MYRRQEFVASALSRVEAIQEMIDNELSVGRTLAYALTGKTDRQMYGAHENSV
jgi:hypothetical protein